MVSLILSFSGGLVIALAAFSFIFFLLASFFTMWSQFFPESPKIELIVKWNQRFTFLKTLTWQFTIYLFAAVSLLAIFSEFLL